METSENQAKIKKSHRAVGVPEARRGQGANGDHDGQQARKKAERVLLIGDSVQAAELEWAAVERAA